MDNSVLKKLSGRRASFLWSFAAKGLFAGSMAVENKISREML